MINQNIRKLRCVIPDGTAGKYPRLLSLFDNNENHDTGVQLHGNLYEPSYR